jgi:hypothetical protein
MSLNGLFLVVGVFSLIAGFAIPVFFYFQKGVIKIKYSLPLFAIASASILFQTIFYYQPPGVNALIQFPSGKQVCHTEPGYHLRFFGNIIEMQKYIPVQIEKRFVLTIP